MPISNEQLSLIKPYCRCRYHRYSWYDLRRLFANKKGCLYTDDIDDDTIIKTLVYMTAKGIPYTIHKPIYCSLPNPAFPI